MFLENQNVPEIRLLPMSKQDEFYGEQIARVQKEFFRYDLFQREGGKYYYRSSGIRSNCGSLILFQYDNMIIASAQLNCIEKYEKPYDKKYYGALIFYNNSVEVFEPISLIEIQSIDPNIRAFRRSKQYIDISKLFDILKLLGEKKDLYSKTYQEKVNQINVIDKTIIDEPVERPELVDEHLKIWKRDPIIAKKALIDANFECLIDPKHLSFISKATKQNYVESHHLIPMCYQDRFSNSIDVEANIVSLCPICHKKLHLAELQDKEPLLNRLFSIRINRLKKCKISFNINELREFYK